MWYQSISRPALPTSNRTKAGKCECKARRDRAKGGTGRVKGGGGGMEMEREMKRGGYGLSYRRSRGRPRCKRQIGAVVRLRTFPVRFSCALPAVPAPAPAQDRILASDAVQPCRNPSSPCPARPDQNLLWRKPSRTPPGCICTRTRTRTRTLIILTLALETEAAEAERAGVVTEAENKAKGFRMGKGYLVAMAASKAR